jgi:hypothetical protein
VSSATPEVPAVPETTAPPLRLGVMVDGRRLRRWEHWMLTELAATGRATLALVALNATPGPPRPPRTLRDKLFHPPRDLLWHRYRNWDYRRHRAADNAYAWVDATDLFAVAPQIDVVALKPKSYEYRFDAPTTEQIRAADLDIMLRLGFGIVRGDVLDVPRLGTWSFHRGDNHRFRGNPGLFWEIHDRDPVSGVVLQRLTDALDGGHVLYRSSATTNFDSYQLSRNPIQWKAAQFVGRTIDIARRGGWDAITATPHYEAPSGSGPAARRNPSNREMTRFLARRAARKVARATIRRPRPGPPRWPGESLPVGFATALRTGSPTVYHAGADHWLFLTLAVEGQSLDDELYLFHATSAAGPWEAHPSNPVVSDARCARPCGPVSVRDGVAVRPVLDASTGAARDMRIDRLDMRAFEQSPLR